MGVFYIFGFLRHIVFFDEKKRGEGSFLVRNPMFETGGLFSICTWEKMLVSNTDQDLVSEISRST